MVSPFAKMNLKRFNVVYGLAVESLTLIIPFSNANRIVLQSIVQTRLGENCTNTLNLCGHPRFETENPSTEVN